MNRVRVDFNSIDKGGRQIVASRRFADHPPFVGEQVRLWDAEGNEATAIVREVRERAVTCSINIGSFTGSSIE